MWAIFTDDGIPSWFGPEPVKGSEELDESKIPEGNDLTEFLIVNRRLSSGEWVPRDPPPPPPEPTGEDREAEYQSALASRLTALREAIEADPMYLDWQMGIIDREIWVVRAAEIAEGFPIPER